MKDDLAQLRTDLKNTDNELREIVRIRKHLYWFLVLGLFTSPLGFLWHWIMCFVVFGLFGVLYATAYYISYGHTKGLNRRRDLLSEQLTNLGHPPELN